MSAHTPGRCGVKPGNIPWNAGTSQGWTDKRGYRWLYVNEGGKRVARREHRVLMERHLGRRLEPWEIVHHKDENPSNNNLDNLEVMDFGTHTGAHSLGRRKDADAKRSMEAFALMREELKRERIVRAELLTALNGFVLNWRHLNDDHFTGPRDKLIALARAAIAKAEGRDGAA